MTPLIIVGKVRYRKTVVAKLFPTLDESDLARKAFPPEPERAGRVACLAADEYFSARISQDGNSQFF